MASLWRLAGGRVHNLGLLVRATSSRIHQSMFRTILLGLIATQTACIHSQGDEPLNPTSALVATLSQYVEDIPVEFDGISADRAQLLENFAERIVDTIRRDEICRLNFICTHNSRRSHLSQVWAQTAALQFGIDKIETYSGGTEATACNLRTIAALRRAGFEIDQLTGGENPHYRVRYSDRADPLEAFSKVYDDTKAGNPDKHFIAAMCCDQADRECPIVKGATARIPVHYEDPKAADNTPAESQVYDKRCRQIAVEMFYVMQLVAQKL